MQFEGVPAHVLHEEWHSTHLSSTSTLTAGSHCEIQLSWKKYGHVPLGSQLVHESTFFSHVRQFSLHGMQRFLLESSNKP